MGYAAMILAAVLNSVCNVVGECYNRRVKRTNPFCYTLIVSVMVFLVYWIYGRFSFAFDWLTLGMGAAYGVCYCLYFVFMLRALASGYVSLVSLIIAYSLMIPTLFGLIFYRSYPGAFFYVGLALLMIAVFLIGKKKETKSAEEGAAKKRSGGKWIAFALAAMLVNGTLSILQTYQQTEKKGFYKSEFMMIAMAVVFVFSCVSVYIFARRDKETVAVNFRKGGWIAAVYGIANAVLNFLVMVCVGLLPARLIFSTICGISLALTLLLSLLFFKEKLTRRQLAGFLVGLISTIFMNI